MRIASRLLTVIFIFIGSVLYTPSSLSAFCTITIDSATPLSSQVNLVPGSVLCLRGGTYPVTQLQLLNNGTKSSGIVMQSAPGEIATLKATGAGGLYVRGSYWTLDHLVIDNNGFSNAAVTVNTSATGFTLSNSEIKNGRYYGVDVWAPNARIENNSIHDFWPSDKVPGNDAQCANIHATADYGQFISNTTQNCWGDGIQFFTPTVFTSSTLLATNWLISGNTFLRGNLDYSENGLDIKGGQYFTITNNIFSGFIGNKLGTQQPAVVFHHDAWDMLFNGNTISNSFQGIQLSAGIWTRLEISQNTFISTTQYAVEFAGCASCSFQFNTIKKAGQSLLFASSGINGLTMSHNLFVQSGAPVIAPGARFNNLTLLANAWYSTLRGVEFVLGPADLVGTGDPGFVTGFGVSPALSIPSVPTITPTPTSTATSTATETPTETPTITPTETETPTQTPMPTATVTGCWDLRQVTPVQIPCP